MKAKAVSLDFFRWSKSVLSLRVFFFFLVFAFSVFLIWHLRERERERERSVVEMCCRQPIIFSLQSKHTWILVPNGKKNAKTPPYDDLVLFFFLFYKSYKKLVQDSIWNIWKTQWYNWKPWVVFAINPILRALALGNVTLSHFTILKSYCINYTIPFYNTPNIPKFYFSILHIKIIYLNNKIFFSNFFLHLPSTSITAPPLPSHHHRASTMPTTAHYPPKSH